ncbi:MAG: response regulator [Caulobacterales bacterium]|nr:response regulator [Caulobacterales bacterium]
MGVLAVVISVFIALSACGAFALWLIARRENAALKERLKRQGRLLSGAAQQLRAPLNDVLGLVQTLAMRGNEFSDENRSLVETVAGSGATAKAVLLDVFDILEIEAGQMKLHPRVTLLTEIVDFVRRANAPLATKKNVVVEYDVTSSARVWLAFDDMRLRQCASAMLRQAINQGQKKIQFSISVAKDDKQKHQRRITITVKDDAANVGDDVLSGYFSLSGVNKINSGSGSPLSLFVSRLLAREMGGELSATRAQEGVALKLTAPAKFARDAHEDSNSKDLTPFEAARGLMCDRTVLLVEDNAANQKVLEAYLKPVQPKKILAAHNGEAALSLLAHEKCDLVLMDTQMPVMNGLAATHMIRASGKEWSDVPIIAISAGERSEEREAAFTAGANAFLSKPLSADDLYEKIVRVASA